MGKPAIPRHSRILRTNTFSINKEERNISPLKMVKKGSVCDPNSTSVE
jgi:hypothetical protein